MELTCPACGVRYRVADAAVPVAGRIVRCGNCRCEWRARRRQAGGALAGAAAAGAVDPASLPEPAFAARPAALAASGPALRGAPVDAFAVAAGMAPPPRAAAPQSMAASLQPQDAPAGRGGFMVGFALVSLLALAAVGLYARHDAITAVAPQLAPAMERYVALVDQARGALAGLVARQP